MQAYAHHGKVVNREGSPLDSVAVTVYTAAMDSLMRVYTADDGTFAFSHSASAAGYVRFSHPRYSERMIGLGENNDLGVITMDKPVALDEVVITPRFMEQYLEHRSYKLKPEAVKRYNTFFQALSEIPNLIATKSGGLFYEGSSNVKLLLNGVESSEVEISTLAAEDISKVNVYRTPPARFQHSGVDAVIDVITKSNLTGGNVAVNLQDAFIPLKGENSAAFYYNYKRSRVSLLYNNNFRFFDKYRLDETLDYEFDGVEYNKVKTGLDSDDEIKNHSLTLSYQNNLYNSYLVNVKTGGNFNREDGDYAQDVKTNRNRHYLARKQLNTRYDNYWGSAYYEKNFDRDPGGRLLMANVKWSHYKNRYFSSYAETPQDEWSEEEKVKTASAYKTRYDAVLGEIQYKMKEQDWGQLSFVLYDTYKYSRYADTDHPFFLRNNNLGGLVQYNGHKGRFRYTASLGVQYTLSDAYSLSKRHTLWVPRPILRLYYTPSQNLNFRLDYTYLSNLPTVAQLSETNQWIDTKYVYHGNASLKPYKSHNVSLQGVLTSKYLNANLRANLRVSPGMTCSHFFRTDDYMLETIINLDKYTVVDAQLDMTVKPLGNTTWMIWNRFIVGRTDGKGVNYEWDGHRFQWMFINTVNLDKWSMEAFYQYPGTITEGQLVRPRGQCWSVSAFYRPVNGMSVGLEWWMPFGKYFGDSERSVSSAPVHTHRKNRICDWKNMLSVCFSYNFSFGKNRNRAKPRFSNSEGSDAGILKK